MTQRLQPSWRKSDMLFFMTREEMIQRDFGAKLRQLRQEKGFSQEKVALDAGMDRTYVNSVENGKRNISLCNIVKLAKALGTTAKAFF